MTERKELGKFDGQRRKFTGVFVRFGTKRGWQGAVDETILLKNVIDVASGKLVTDHLWFNRTMGFDDAIHAVLGDPDPNIPPYDKDLTPQELDDLDATALQGKVFEFTARVEDYVKGYHGRKAEEEGEAWSAKDWKLSRPTKIKILLAHTEKVLKFVELACTAKKQDEDMKQEEKLKCCVCGKVAKNDMPQSNEGWSWFAAGLVGAHFCSDTCWFSGQGVGIRLEGKLDAVHARLADIEQDIEDIKQIGIVKDGLRLLELERKECRK